MIRKVSTRAQFNDPIYASSIDLMQLRNSALPLDTVQVLEHQLWYPIMERLPSELCLKVFCSMDHQNLASAQLVCRKWSILASDDTLWSNLFIQRWGIDCATFYSPRSDSTKSWKDVYVIQDRCDRIGLGLKLITEGDDCYLIHQGEVQKHLGSRRKVVSSNSSGQENEHLDEPCIGVLDRILFFAGDLEVASEHAKRRKF